MFRHREHHRCGPSLAGAGRTGRRSTSRRADRLFDNGELRLVVLKLLAEAPRHGYELIKAIEERVGGAYSPSPGVIYPTLTFLEELGLVTVEAASGGKKLCAITAEGHAALEAESETVERVFARMAAVHERFEGPSPRLRRAMGNLAGAIGVRMSAGPLDAAQLDRIIELIDAAAQSVEKT